jgi:hypothetical protein
MVLLASSWAADMAAATEEADGGGAIPGIM